MTYRAFISLTNALQISMKADLTSDRINRINSALQTEVASALPELSGIGLAAGAASTQFEWKTPRGNYPLIKDKYYLFAREGDLSKIYREWGLDPPSPEVQSAFKEFYKTSIWGEYNRYDFFIRGDRKQLKITDQMSFQSPENEIEFQRALQESSETRKRVSGLEQALESGRGKSIGTWVSIPVNRILPEGKPFVAYDILNAHRKRLSGCWKLSQGPRSSGSATSIEKCKSDRLTCISDHCDGGGLCCKSDSLYPINESTGKDIPQEKICDFTTANPCSTYCNCDSPDVNCPNNTTLSCLNLDLWGALSDLSSGVVESKPVIPSEPVQGDDYGEKSGGNTTTSSSSKMLLIGGGVLLLLILILVLVMVFRKRR